MIYATFTKVCRVFYRYHFCHDLLLSLEMSAAAISKHLAIAMVCMSNNEIWQIMLKLKAPQNSSTSHHDLIPLLRVILSKCFGAGILKGWMQTYITSRWQKYSASRSLFQKQNIWRQKKIMLTTYPTNPMSEMIFRSSVTDRASPFWPTYWLDAMPPSPPRATTTLSPTLFIFPARTQKHVIREKVQNDKC